MFSVLQYSHFLRSEYYPKHFVPQHPKWHIILQLAGTWKGKDRQEENMEAVNTKVEQVVWVLSLIMTVKRKARSILPASKKKVHKNKRWSWNTCRTK